MSESVNHDALLARLAPPAKVARAAGEKAMAYFQQRDSLVAETKHDLQAAASTVDRVVVQLIEPSRRAQHRHDGTLVD